MQEKVSGIANQIGYQRYLAEYAGFTGQDSSALLENVNFKDYYGKTPIFSQSSAWNGDARLLIDLGANVHVADNYGVPPPLHLASLYRRKEAMKALLDAGVDVNIRSGRIDWPRFLTPLEKTLLQDRLPYEELLKDLPAPLEHGAEITDQCREFLHKSEEHFQHVKRGITDLHFQRSQAEKPGLPLGKGRPRLCCTGPLS